MRADRRDPGRPRRSRRRQADRTGVRGARRTRLSTFSTSRPRPPISIVVGSRGLRGLRALGSLSERIAHEARCSVLVVRSPRWRSRGRWLGARIGRLAGHYLPDLVYGANDGIITTFAVVSGVVGASLSERVIVILGLANLVADGFSMGASNYLARRSHLEEDLADAQRRAAPRSGDDRRVRRGGRDPAARIPRAPRALPHSFRARPFSPALRCSRSAPPGRS